MITEARSMSATVIEHVDAVEWPQDNRALRAELARLEPVVGAALLAATAFRLRDHEALISALRMLVQVTRSFEEHDPAA